LEKTLDILWLAVTNTLVTLTKGFAMKVQFAAKLVNLVIAAALFAPVAFTVLQQAALVLA
jgi:hypothetical protein